VSGRRNLLAGFISPDERIAGHDQAQCSDVAARGAEVHNCHAMFRTRCEQTLGTGNQTAVDEQHRMMCDASLECALGRR
jgi:hypothetical protein